MYQIVHVDNQGKALAAREMAEKSQKTATEAKSSIDSILEDLLGDKMKVEQVPKLQDMMNINLDNVKTNSKSERQ